ncbi:MAG TPA: prepilin-type N-terminal cleavage/methylation domain-containing protein [Mycobacteriales bacterium]|nr:prepilin-type N-terminal cleavage/methylation domain-containing protein [Mycobacteriales bacterium]
MNVLRSGERSDAGFTLTELLVSIVLFGVVSAMVTTASISGLHRQTQVANRDAVLAQMRTVLQRVDRDIRSADPLLSASSTQLVLEEAQPGATRVMTYSLTGSELVVDESTTTSNGLTTTAPHKVLLQDVVATPSSPVFSPAPISGYVAPTGSGVNASTCALSNGTIDIGCVGKITVNLTVQPEHVAAPLTLSDHGVELRNA